MRVSDRRTKQCTVCGKDYQGTYSSKYCDECRPSKAEVAANRYQERKAKKLASKQNTEPIEKVKEVVKDETKDKDNVNVVGDSGIKELPDEPTEPKTEVQPSTKNEVNSIQIIDSNTGKKEKGIVDQVLEKLFSDDLAPITTSILASLATRLQQPNNATEEGILTAEDGSKHAMI